MEHSLPAVTLMTKYFFRTVFPRQDSACARRALERIRATTFRIHFESPDLNCIENLFCLVNKKLQTDTIDNNIEKKTFEEFSERKKNIMRNFNVETIDKIIGTMAKRITEVIKHKGQRIKY